MILKRSSTLGAHVMVLLWVLADLADKGGMLFGDQASSHVEGPFNASYGFIMLTLLTPVPRRPRVPISAKLVALMTLILTIGVLIVIAIVTLSSNSPTRVQFALDLVFATLVLFMMWRLPNHDLELVERGEKGSVFSPAAS